MTKTKAVYLISFPVCIIVLLSLMLGEYAAFPQDKPIPAEPQPHIIQVVARGFCDYGWDKAGNEYGTGYVIVSAHGPIPLGSYLDIDLFGEAQAMTTTTSLAANEILVWMQSPSEVKAFGEQTAWVRILGEGEKLNEN